MLELGPGGETTRYDGPSTFTRDGSEPIARPKPARALGRAAPNALLEAAAGAELSPDLLEAVARQESGLRQGVVSRAGAIGEMQLMPETARKLRVDPNDSRDNYRGGAAYLRQMLRRYDGDVVRALAAYNAGPGAVDRHGGPPPFPETQAYVAAVLERLSRKAEQGASAP